MLGNNVIDGGRWKILHINMPLRPMAPPWQPFPSQMAYGIEKTVMPFCHGRHLKTLLERPNVLWCECGWCYASTKTFELTSSRF
jgi:hypothetical protein